MTFTNPIPNSHAAAITVKREWLRLIQTEGMEAAKQFMEQCRSRDQSPSSHLDVAEFLEAGKSAMRHYISSKLNEALSEIDF